MLIYSRGIYTAWALEGSLYQMRTNFTLLKKQLSQLLLAPVIPCGMLFSCGDGNFFSVPAVILWQHQVTASLSRQNHSEGGLAALHCTPSAAHEISRRGPPRPSQLPCLILLFPALFWPLWLDEELGTRTLDGII